MKIKQLREQIKNAGDDFDIELYFGHSSHPVSSVAVADYGKSVAIHANIDTRLDDAEEALRQIYMLCGNNDPSEGEGTYPSEVVASVKSFLTIKRKK